MPWTIEQLWVRPTVGDLSNVVVTAAWRCSDSVEQDGRTFAGTCYGTSSFPAADPNDFIEFDNLTEEDVLAFVWNAGINKEATEAVVAQQIADQIAPPVITPPLPWAV